jgi:hypothetical protein
LNFSPNRLRVRVACVIFGLNFAAAFSHAHVVVAQNNAMLAEVVPDAPQPIASASPTRVDGSASDPDGSDVRQFFLATGGSRYSTALNPDEKRIPFTVREKFIYSIHESVDMDEFVVLVVGSGFNHLVNGNPHYGTDGNGFGERVGAAALRHTSIHLMGDGMFASVLHQDPRYFRIGAGQPFKQRAKHVFVSAFTSHSDRDGHVQPDYSGLTARAASAAMTLTYYPHISATGPGAVTTFGYSLVREMAADTFLEFMPDLLHPQKKAAQ